jgi:hypothetical protein
LCRAQGPSAEEVEGAPCSDHPMPDVEEVRNGADENGGFNSLLAATKCNLERTRYRLESYLKDVRGLLSTGLLEGFKVIYKKDEVCVIPSGCNVVASA